MAILRNRHNGYPCFMDEDPETQTGTATHHFPVSLQLAGDRGFDGLLPILEDVIISKSF